jgi:signal transduction histidine kinase/ligand-binding sensor domain-containing protein
MQRSVNNVLVAGLIVLGLAAITSAQYRFDRWTTENGLPQNSVNAIVQTRDGYLWLGTFGGLVRFDGARFSIFDPVNTPQLKSNRITALMEDRDGNLWIGAESGELARYRDGEFAAWSGLGGAILSFYQQSSGPIWGLRMSARPIRFMPGQPDQAAVVTFDQGLEGERLYSLREDRAGQLWATTRQGLTVWRDGAFRSDNGVEGLPKRGLPLIATTADDSFWIVEEKGLGRIVNQQFELLVETPHGMGVPPPSLLETRRGEVWFGYREDQLWRGSRDGKFSKVKLWDAPSTSIHAMLEDREGNLWIGSQGGGLIRLRPHRVTTLSQANGLPSDEIQAVCEDGQGGALVLTRAGMSRVEGGQILSWTAAELERLSRIRQPASLYRDQTGTLWIGGHGNLGRLGDGLSAPELRGLSGDISAILLDREGEIWLGTNDGLIHFNNSGVTRILRPDDGLVNREITVLSQDRAAAVWIGTKQGLSQFKDGRFINYTTANGLSSNSIRDLYEAQDGALWIGTYGGGLNRLKDGRVIHITTRQGLFDDVVSRILVDDRDRFWMLGNRGIFYVSRQQLNEVADGRSKVVTCGSYGVADGMLSSEGNGLSQPAGWRMRDGRLWFSTIKGLAIVDPSEVAITPPPVVIESATLDGGSVGVREAIRLAPGQQNLELHFTALHFGKPEQVRFKYRLDGLDHDWTDVGTRRAANFPHLPPGTYTFQVTAASPDGVWNEQSTSILIIVRPRFYQTWWFATLVVAGFVGALFLGFKLRVNQVQRARAQQEEFSRRLIESQEMERKRIAAELHDSLGQNLLVIKNRASIAKATARDLPAAFEQLDLIADSTMQAIQEVRQIAYNLRPHHLDNVGLSRSIEEMLRRVEEASGIAIACEIESLDGALPKKVEINLYRIVQEAVSNIVKHAEAKQAGVEIERHEDRLHLTIRDNGCGFEVQETSERRGFGLAGIAERVRILGGSHQIESEPGKGTTIRVEIPLGNQREGVAEQSH